MPTAQEQGTTSTDYDRAFLAEAGIAAEQEVEEEKRRIRLEEARRAEAAETEAAEEDTASASSPSADQSRRKISAVEAGLMIATALTIDGFQAGIAGLGNLALGVPVAGPGISFLVSLFASLIGLWAWLLFFLWFRSKGMDWRRTTQRFLTLALGGMIELIPLLNALPAWTLAVIINIVFDYVSSRVPAVAQSGHIRKHP